MLHLPNRATDRTHVLQQWPSKMARCSAGQTANAAYSVQRGDTLSGIAAEHGTTVTELMRLNDIGNPNTIFVGQEIRLP